MSGLVMSGFGGPSVAGCALAALLVTGCGAGAAGDSASPSGSGSTVAGSGAAAGASSASPGTASDGDIAPPEPHLVDMVMITAAGGAVTAIPTPVDGELARAAYLAGFDQRARAQLRQAMLAAPAPRARSLTATVVDMGCDSPTEVEITPTGSGYEVVAVPPPQTGLQCFAPITSIALVELPSPG